MGINLELQPREYLRKIEEQARTRSSAREATFTSCGMVSRIRDHGFYENPKQLKFLLTGTIITGGDERLNLRDFESRGFPIATGPQPDVRNNENLATTLCKARGSGRLAGTAPKGLHVQFSLPRRDVVGKVEPDNNGTNISCTVWNEQTLPSHLRALNFIASLHHYTWQKPIEQKSVAADSVNKQNHLRTIFFLLSVPQL